MLPSILITPLILLWDALQIKPTPFQIVPHSLVPPQTIPLPTGLPAPVERFYRLTYGERVPVIKTAILTGRGWMRLFGITFPVRFRFNYETGCNFRSYFELTLFGIPVMKANEYFVDGKLRAELPGGVEEGSQKLTQAANARMWIEHLYWLPAVLLTTPGVSWQPVDAVTALLVVPSASTSACAEGKEHLVVCFDPESGELRHVEAMRYKKASDSTKTLWVSGVWFDEGKPWAAWNIEEVALNVAVNTSLEVKGL